MTVILLLAQNQVCLESGGFFFVSGEDDCRTGYFFHCGYEGAILSVIIQISCKEILIFLNMPDY